MDNGNIDDLIVEEFDSKFNENRQLMKAMNDEYTDAYFGNDVNNSVTQNNDPTGNSKPVIRKNNRKSIQINGNGGQIIALSKNNQSFSINSKRDNMFGNE